ncbi:MAG TPA: hypothetical protein VJT67_16065 [Longimicrobiaceae bacterium]|nr:hypothetical protein [Longimicrobiaceae bacterium]
MEKTMKVWRTGDTFSGEFPRGAIERLLGADGGELLVEEREDGLWLRAHSPHREKVRAAFEDLSERYDETLRRLAK